MAIKSIYFYSNSVFPSNTANSISVINTCNALSKGRKLYLSGIQAKSRSLEQLKKFYNYDGTIHLKLLRPIILRGSLQLSAVLDFIRILLIRPDTVYGRSIFTAQILAFFRYPFFFECHDAKWSSSAKYEKRYNRVLNACSIKGLVVVSDNLAKMVKEKYPRYNNIPIAVIRNGAKEHTHTETSHNPAQFTVGYLGGFYKGRGLDVIIDVAHHLPQIQFELAGGTTEQLQAIVGERTVPPNIKCLGYLDPANTADFKNKMNALLAPYQNETTSRGQVNTSAYMSPVKIFEYMATGKPIVSSNLVAIREVLNESNAILVQPKEIKQWVNAISTLAENQLYAADLADNARKYFLQHLTWKKRAENIITFTESMASSQ